MTPFLKMTPKISVIISGLCSCGGLQLHDKQAGSIGNTLFDLPIIKDSPVEMCRREQFPSRTLMK